MSDIFSIHDNSLSGRGRSMPWIEEFVAGTRKFTCEVCRREIEEPVESAELTAVLDVARGRNWPDCLGTGHLSMFVVSERFIEAVGAKMLAQLPIAPVHIEKPYPVPLIGVDPPRYYWVDGRKMPRTELDLVQSGYIGVKTCPCCNAKSWDIEATIDARRAPGARFHFLDVPTDLLFVSSLSDRQFFCRSVVVNLIRRCKLVNFCCTDIELGYGYP